MLCSTVASNANERPAGPKERAGSSNALLHIVLIKSATLHG